MSACIAGIGARQTPGYILKLMTFLGQWCRDHGVYVRSGHADGADYAFECGALGHTIVYLPWVGFNTRLPLKTKHAVFLDRVEPGVRAQAMASVHQFHPNPIALSDVGKKLMARNYFQVMGSKVEPKPVQAVVCWTPQGRGGGGTGQAIRMAKHYDIPVLDLGKGSPTQSSVLDFLASAARRQTGQTDSPADDILTMFPDDREEGCH